MKPTRLVPLVILAAIGLAVGWVAVQLVERFSGRILSVPWAAAIGLVLLAAAVLIWALVSRPRLHDASHDRRSNGLAPASVGTARPVQPPRMNPLVAARTAALAMAASRTGAVIGGFYLGIALALIPVIGSPSGSESLSASVACVVACLILVASAVWLESMCRLRDRDDD
ncbi:MAG: hypothetical protein B7C55_01555 [Actinomycetales bacterium mxb001]|nr:MAG: hypothetical protein B7C55_01555 [Actinomycetales bacterium mxb001]